MERKYTNKLNMVRCENIVDRVGCRGEDRSELAYNVLNTIPVLLGKVAAYRVLQVRLNMHRERVDGTAVLARLTSLSFGSILVTTLRVKCLRDFCKVYSI